MIKHNLLLVVFFCVYGFASYAQDSLKSDLSLNLGYFNDNNRFQYLKASSKTKVDGKFQAAPHVNLKFYIESVADGNLLGAAMTDHSGSAVLYLPASARDNFMKSSKLSFFVVADESEHYNSAQGDVEITKAKLKIDTVPDRKISVVLTELKDSVWTPVKDVDVKVAVQRFGGDLDVDADTKTYTTDSTGTVTASFLRDSLPGDNKGDLVLIAKVEDNDSYGNLSVQQTVSWGKPTVYVSNYDERTLYSRSGKSPLWVNLMAYGIIIIVWSILIYLLFQIRKMSRNS